MPVPMNTTQDRTGRQLLGSTSGDPDDQSPSKDARLVPGFPHPLDEIARHDPWFTTPRPHNLSSPLSRFNWDLPTPSHPSLLVNAIMQARCSISSERSARPVALAMTQSCLLLAGLDQWSYRVPALTYFLLDDTDDEYEFPLDTRHADVGFGEQTYEGYAHAGIDEVNKLMFVADDWRVKSFAWADAQSRGLYEWVLPTHTLNTGDHCGPISVFAPGRILRAGKGSIAFWNLDEVETHGPEGNLVIGAPKSYCGNENPDDPEAQKEFSTGSAATAVIPLADPTFSPAAWHINPNLPGNMLCAPFSWLNDYSCTSLDLDSAQVAARYLGHAGSVRGFSTSEADPTIFLTAATDGYARLYDSRTPLPGLSLASDVCKAAVLIHPDGIPLVFTSSSSEQVIKLWDIRAAKLVCELATGNNEVRGMAWDAPRAVLYVTTLCPYFDKWGTHRDYRAAYPPAGDSNSTYPDLQRGSGIPSYEDDEMGCGLAWPGHASHTEEYFGHMLDAGEHRLFRYAFHDQADPTILPVYGTAAPGFEY
ncbi:hypothetical protein DFH09DRAFT_1109892 [Mycena vulgaris]|nr:hypothetical protein DFH09DRAFT_1109892 [Mycena vulgaris]